MFWPFLARGFLFWGTWLAWAVSRASKLALTAPFVSEWIALEEL
jgi:hypothetical protein